MKSVAPVIIGTRSVMSDKIRNLDVAAFEFTSLISVDAERNFPAYKPALGDKCRGFTVANLETHVPSGLSLQRFLV